jgi:molybdopterin molybdotransferase
MLTVRDAQEIVLKFARRLPAESTPLAVDALGLVLAGDVVSDIDMPPYDKAMMDGYALRSDDLPAGRGSFVVVEEITAGSMPQRTVGSNQAAHIMTGAPMPKGADCVVMVERTRLVDDGRVEVDDRPAVAGQNVLTRAKEMSRGQVVLSAGARLRPQEFGLLATVGMTTVKVVPRPKVAVLSTGDELVEGSAVPGPGQIRNGNGPMLQAQVARAGGLPRYLGIARDDRAHLTELLEEGLQSPVLVLSGGVSAGKRDLVPGALQELAVLPHFHQVAMKPGKPVFFGTRKDTLVFGLPGNPVSSFACFELFVRPALRVLMGKTGPGSHLVQARLAEPFAYKTDRPTYHPAVLENGPDGWGFRLEAWFGSPDLRALTKANALAVLPAGDNQFAAGQTFAVMQLEGD